MRKNAKVTARIPLKIIQRMNKKANGSNVRGREREREGERGDVTSSVRDEDLFVSSRTKVGFPRIYKRDG